MSGLVEQFRIATDTRDQLVNAIKILLVWNKSVTHFQSGKDVYGKPFLTLQWHEAGKGQSLIAPLQSAEAIADQVYAWLKTVEYGEQPDTDGHNSKGWLIETLGPKMTNDKYELRSGMSRFYDVFTVYPFWVTYEK